MWKSVKGYEGLYEVSNLGNVKSITRYKKQLKPSLDKDGYRYVKLKHNNSSKHARIARLVAIAFIPTNDETKEVNHIDYNRQNDNVNNLEWVTRKQNTQHSSQHYKGSRHKKIIQTKGGKTIEKFNSMMDAERKTGIKASNICKCCKGQRNHAGGYEWRYA